MTTVLTHTLQMSKSFQHPLFFFFNTVPNYLSKQKLLQTSRDATAKTCIFINKISLRRLVKSKHRLCITFRKQKQWVLYWWKMLGFPLRKMQNTWRCNCRNLFFRSLQGANMEETWVIAVLYPLSLLGTRWHLEAKNLSHQNQTFHLHYWVL